MFELDGQSDNVSAIHSQSVNQLVFQSISLPAGSRSVGLSFVQFVRSSRPIVKVNCLTKLVDSLIIIIRIIYYLYSAEYMWI